RHIVARTTKGLNIPTSLCFAINFNLDHNSAFRNQDFCPFQALSRQRSGYPHGGVFLHAVEWSESRHYRAATLGDRTRRRSIGQTVEPVICLEVPRSRTGLDGSRFGIKRTGFSEAGVVPL